MAASMAFSGQALGRNIYSKASKGLALTTSPFRKTGQPDHVLMKRVSPCLSYELCAKRSTKNRPYGDHKLHAVISLTNSSDFGPSDTVEQFYECINKKNLKKLGKFISNDCFFEDFSFPKPFQGKKEVLKFFEQLITCMGENTEFNVGNFCEGEEGDRFTVVVNWHLDWKKNQIPFTRGCSLYELSTEGERLLIKKAQVMVESPMKPGALALNLLKILTSLFDAFPEVAEWFLRSPHVILLKIYSVVLVPFIRPLLAFYINLWNFIALILSFAFKIYLQISKTFRN